MVYLLFHIFHLVSIIIIIISITLLWYDAIHDATCIPVNVYIMLYMILCSMLYIMPCYGAIHEKYMMQCLALTNLP